MMSDSKTCLWLIRHGETEWSMTGRHTSRTDVPLTPLGRERAVELRSYLQPIHFTAVFRSPMARARDTCEIAGLEPHAIIDTNLCEWNYGIYEGRTTPEIRHEIPGWSVWNNPIPGGESLDQVAARADAVIARALAVAPPGDVALFSHAHVLRILTARWLRLEPNVGALFALGTGSVSVLGWERDTRVLAHWNRIFGG